MLMMMSAIISIPVASHGIENLFVCLYDFNYSDYFKNITTTHANFQTGDPIKLGNNSIIYLQGKKY